MCIRAFIHNGQNAKATKKSLGRWMDKCRDDELLLSIRKKCAVNPGKKTCRELECKWEKTAYCLLPTLNSLEQVKPVVKRSVVSRNYGGGRDEWAKHRGFFFLASETIPYDIKMVGALVKTHGTHNTRREPKVNYVLWMRPRRFINHNTLTPLRQGCWQWILMVLIVMYFPYHFAVTLKLL